MCMNIHALSSLHYREMGSIARILQTRNDVRYHSLGLQKGQNIFLTRLCENPGATVVKLARLARVDQTTATKAVQKLEGAGYVTRTPHPDDRRSQTLVPTDRAAEAYRTIIRAENDDLVEGLQGFSTAETEQLLKFLVRIRENLDRGAS